MVTGVKRPTLAACSCSGCQKAYTEALIQELKKRSEWISCDERLPKTDQEVLFFTKNIHFGPMHSVDDLPECDELRHHGDNYYWVALDDGCATYRSVEVSHWMPLPPLPNFDYLSVALT